MSAASAARSPEERQKLRASIADKAGPLRLEDADLSVLSGRLRQVVELRLQGLSHSEIARRLGIAPKVSMVYLSQARQVLRHPPPKPPPAPPAPANDTGGDDDGRCWVPGCGSVAVESELEHGLCEGHFRRIRYYLARGGVINGHVFDVLGMRLNVLQETGGACLRDPGPCSLTLCRYHGDDAVQVDVRERQDLSEPCGIKLARRGPMTLDEVGRVCGWTRERSRQVEMSALKNLQDAVERSETRRRPG